MLFVTSGMNKNFISIPLGAIKTHEESAVWKKGRISIPLGAIKTPARHSFRSPVPIFQFHLVRLKLKPSKSSAVPGPISIPLGAIKTINVKHLPSGSIKFQFHLVRLKLYFQYTLPTNFVFQFHLVRLKPSRGRHSN